MDYIVNGQGQGEVAGVLMHHNFDPNALRPWVGRDGRSYITTNDAGGVPRKIVTNTPATLRRDDWLVLDRAVIQSAKPRLNAVADARAAGLQLVIPNGLGKLALEHEAVSDIGPATTSMDGMREGQADRPLFDLRTLPLPITHKDFHFSARQLAASRNGGSPLDTTNAALAGRRVAEAVEETYLGTGTAYKFGGGYVYGLANFTNRLTKTITTPGTNATTLTEVLAMRKQSTDNYYYGPWTLYYGPGWYSQMDTDYSSAKGDNTLKDRLEAITGIDEVKPADYLTTTGLLLVQKTADVARVIVGMDITTVQWPSHGGMQINFKVMAIIVPQVRGDYANQCGIVHGTV